MKNVFLILALVAAATLGCTVTAEAGNTMGTHAHNGYHHNFNGFGYGGYGGYGYNSLAYYPTYVYSPPATTYVPVTGDYGAGYGAGGCNSGYAQQQLVTVAPAYPTFYGAGAYGAYPGYNSFFFSRFIRGRNQVFRH